MRIGMSHLVVGNVQHFFLGYEVPVLLLAHWYYDLSYGQDSTSASSFQNLSSLRKTKLLLF